MRIQITGRNIAISDPIAKYVNKRVGKFDRLFGDDVEAQVRLSIDRYRQICEVTIPLRGVTLRAEEATNDMYTSIDNVIGKLERQIRKYRTRLEKRMRQDADTAEVYEAPFQEAEAGQLVRTKHFALEPMDVDSAIEQMELLGHSFFMFKDEQSGSIQTVYKRTDGNYGLLIPDD